MRERRPTTEELLRLDAIAKKLRLRTRWGDRLFTTKVVDASLQRVNEILRSAAATTGEEVADALADYYAVRFEEVRNSDDIDRLEDKYLRQEREIGFGQLRAELSDPGTDALLFERFHAKATGRDRWIAVLNLQQSGSRAYFNQFHELAHRIAEPPQGVLPFRRHRVDAVSPLERLIDQIGGTLAFYPPIFRPMVEETATSEQLSLRVTERLRQSFAPTASLLASLNAVIRFWPGAAIAVTATMRGRKRNPVCDVGLRVTPQAQNARWRRAELFMIPNMRVPVSSPIWIAFQENRHVDGIETLDEWSTSSGKSLPGVRVFSSGERLGELVYGTLCVMD